MNAKRLLDKARAQDALISIFVLIVGGGDQNRQEAADQIRDLTNAERRDLRATLQDLDELLDDTILAMARERRPWKL